MTPAEIHSFIQRLVHCKLEPGELSALTTRDLGDISVYLTEHDKADLDPSVDTLVPILSTQSAKRTYSEEEILLEFGVRE